MFTGAIQANLSMSPCRDIHLDITLRLKLGRFRLYLLEPLDFVLQLHLPGPAAEVGQAGGRAPAASRPLRLQLEHMQMLQLSAKVFYQLDTDRT